MTDPLNPLIVQSDHTVLLEVASPKADEARASLARFAELEKSPEHIHTYRITPLSLWNAASAGVEVDDVVATLTDYAKYPVPGGVPTEVRDQMARYGRLRLIADEADDPHASVGHLRLTTTEPALLAEVAHDKAVAALLADRIDGQNAHVRLADRGLLKQALLRLGWPVADEAGYVHGTDLTVGLIAELRRYQHDAVATWWADGSAAGGNGVLVLPCGAGKTVIGLAALVKSGTQTLIVVTSIMAARQWIDEILAKTDLGPDDVGEYSGEHKDIRPVTVATYQVLTWTDPKVKQAEAAAAEAAGADDGDELIVRDLGRLHPHLGLFNERQWGLVVYDEVHLLPAPVFRATAQIQAVRRLGLTATLVREDGKEGDVFSLIGPKRYDAPWRDLEDQGWIAPATCTEIRVDLDAEARMAYATSTPQLRYRVAATAEAKLAVIDQLLLRHPDDRVLVIGQYLDQLQAVAEHLEAPLITGQTSQNVRAERFEAFRNGDLRRLVVSKVANFSIDLPEANVAIQISGAFGSRQEEAQRLGRILRPKADGGQAHFYTIVTRETVDQEFAAKRQRFLAEQGYAYIIEDADLAPY